jgi:putative component of toxin-antitoxin plasmid stabilization module
MIELRDYEAEDGRIPIKEWLRALADRTARARIAARLARMGADISILVREIEAGRL